MSSGVDGLPLTNESAIDQIVLSNEGVKVGIFGNINDGLGTIELMQENLHLWIKIYLY